MDVTDHLCMETYRNQTSVDCKALVVSFLLFWLNLWTNSRETGELFVLPPMWCLSDDYKCGLDTHQCHCNTERTISHYENGFFPIYPKCFIFPSNNNLAYNCLHISKMQCRFSLAVPRMILEHVTSMRPDPRISMIYVTKTVSQKFTDKTEYRTTLSLA